jgi:signal transduction histidine kinase
VELEAALPNAHARQPIWVLGVLLGTVAASLVAATFLLGTRNDYSLTYLSFVLSEPLGALVGGLIIARQPRNPVGWLIVVHAFSFITGEFCRQYALYGVVTAPGALPFAHALAWPAYWVWGPGIFCGFAMMPFFFPDGRKVSPRWRVGFWFIIAGMLSATINMALQPGDMETPGVPNPLGILPPLREDGSLGAMFGLLWVASALVGIASLAVRFRRADPDERRQIQWLLYAVVLMVIGDRLVPDFGIVAELLLALSLTGIWAAIGIAMLRYRLYDIEPIINRTLVYGALTALVVGIYVAIVAYLGALLQLVGMLGIQSGLPLQLLATGVVAVLFQPLRDRLQRGVNRLLYGHRDEPYVVLARLGQRLGVALSPADVLPTVVETVRETMKLPYVAIALRDHDQDVITAASGTQVSAQTTLPLVYQHERIGALILGQRAPSEAFTDRERRLLDDLAHHISIAAHAVRLNHDLQISRERIVSAREEERRRLQRDLHDGLGPTLASLTMQLDAARALMAHDPATSDALLTEVKDELQATVGSVRRLVYQLRPPALDQFGLAAALRERLLQHDQRSGVRLSFEIPDTLPPLPAAVEAAAYYIGVEAVNNVLRHAQAQHCRVQLSIAHELTIVVADDGVGLPEQVQAGVGLRSMRERAEELGGTCIVQPTLGGGTEVRARLPLEGNSHGQNTDIDR